MIDHVDHIVLTTRDKDACIRFYSGVLGMKLEKFRTPTEERWRSSSASRRSTCTNGAGSSSRAPTWRCRVRWIYALSPQFRLRML